MQKQLIKPLSQIISDSEEIGSEIVLSKLTKRPNIIKLTQAERNHLLNLILENEHEGSYYGNRIRYWLRSEKLKEKLR